MRILIVSEYSPESGTAAGQRVRGFLDGLRAAGHDVDVITPVFKFRFAKTSMLRPLNYAFFPLELMVRALFLNADFFLITVPPPFIALPFALYGKRFILDVRDPWPESLTAYGVFDHPLIVKAVRRLMNFIYGRAKAITTVTQKVGRMIKRPYVLLRNAINNEYKKIPIEVARRYVEQRIGGFEKLAVFVGNMGYAYDFSGLRPMRGVKLVFIGEGIQAEDLRRRGFTVLPPMAAKELQYFLAAADIGLLPLRRSPLFDAILPAKIFDYIAYGLTIAAKHLPAETRDYLKKIKYDRIALLKDWVDLKNLPTKTDYEVPEKEKWKERVKKLHSLLTALS